MATALPNDLKFDRVVAAELRIKLLGAQPATMAKLALVDGDGVTYGQTVLHTCSPETLRLIRLTAASFEQDMVEAMTYGTEVPGDNDDAYAPDANDGEDEDLTFGTE